jgi:hypothetical protein
MTLYRADYLKRRTTLLAEKPWETPAVGDHAQTADGRLYRHVVRFETTSGKPLSRAPSGVGFAGGYTVAYADQYGHERKCFSSSWTAWCAKAVRDGGHYRRAEEEAT